MAMIGKVKRMHFREKKSVREIVRLTSLSRNTVRKWLKAPVLEEPRYRRGEAPGKLTPFHDAIRQALKVDAHRPRHERRTARALHAQIKLDGYAGGYRSRPSAATLTTSRATGACCTGPSWRPMARCSAIRAACPRWRCCWCTSTSTASRRPCCGNCVQPATCKPRSTPDAAAFWLGLTRRRSIGHGAMPHCATWRFLQHLFGPASGAWPRRCTALPGTAPPCWRRRPRARARPWARCSRCCGQCRWLASTKSLN